MEFGTKQWSDFLINQAKAIGIGIDRTHSRLFSDHAAELIKWNQKINLTTITDPKDVATNHFLDSLIPVRFLPPEGAMVDIGSGGGFPGIPIKVLLPKLSVTLIDASRKKVSFLKHVLRTLKLDNIEAHHLRAEEFANHPNQTHQFDVIISRALTSLTSFVRMALPLLDSGGIIIALKGDLNNAELVDLRNNVLNKLNSAASVDRSLTMSLERYRLPYHTSERTIVTLRQTPTFQ